MARSKQIIKSLSSSFVIKNEIKEAPKKANLVKRINGFKVVSNGSDNLLPYQIAEIVKGSVTLSNIIYSIIKYKLF